ncbi:MAG: DUF3267 domain-containing protein [Clostridiales bacterium]|nr:DUF3267 domain-containing protein [Clostridiales bacterium]
MTKSTVYKSVGRLDMYSAQNRFIHYMNRFALIGVLVFSAVGLVLNYVFRMLGDPGGPYLLYSLLCVPLCVAYIYIHEYLHALAVLIIKRERPRIKFDKLIASCGSSTIVFGKAEYFFVATFPFLFFCAALIPLCIFLPPLFFPMPFAPLVYNLFGSAGDFYMIQRAMSLPKGGAVIDKGTEIVLYVPVDNK